MAYRTELQKDGVFLEKFPNDDANAPIGGVVVKDPLTALEYLLDVTLPEEEGDTLKVFWDLDASIAPILRLINIESLKVLHKTKRVQVGKFGLFYMPEKLFSVRSGKYQSSYYNLKQYALKDEDDFSQDVMGCCFYARVVYDAFKKLGMTPKKLSSPVAVFTDCVLDHLDLPSVKDG